METDRSSRSLPHVVFAGAVAVLALHIVADAFLAPEPGAPLPDHVLSAGIPLVLAAAVVVAYPRLRPGIQAAMALVLGLVTMVGGAVSLTQTLRSGPAGDGWTGLLLLPAGLTLCLLGIRTLWLSRRGGRGRYARRALYVVGALLVAYWVVLPLGTAVFATHRARVEVVQADLGRPYEPVRLRTSDGLTLAGWYLPSRNGSAVIAFPREWTQAHARFLASQGYGVLLLDMRGYGESEGDPNAYGWGAARDVDAGVAFLQERQEVDPDRIGALGLSVGGEQVLEAAADNPGLRAVVAEGAGERSVAETIIRGPQAALAIPAWAVQTAAVAVLSADRPPRPLDDLVAQIAPRSVLLIYAGRGGGGEELNPAYHAAAGEPKALWLIPEAGHTAGLSTRPEEYQARVLDFFERTLLQPDTEAAGDDATPDKDAQS